jgi:GTP-binding protein HflX
MKVLSEIDAAGIPQVLVLNKVDLVPDADADADALRNRVLGEAAGERQTRSVSISARTGQRIDTLLTAVDQVLPFDPVTEVVFRVPLSEPSRISLLHASARVLETRYEGDFAEIRAEVPESVRSRLAEFTAKPD